MILPALALLFAVAGVVVTNASPKVFLPAVSDHALDCEEIGECVADTNSTTCETDANKDLDQIVGPGDCDPYSTTSFGDFDPIN